MLKWIENQNNFNEIREKYTDYLVLLFWGDFSPAAQRALSELKQFSGIIPPFQCMYWMSRK